MPRAIAICVDGSIMGTVFSVDLDESGQPQPLHSRAPLLGELYIPDKEVDIDTEHNLVAQFGSEIEHVSAWEYKSTPYVATPFVEDSE